jgi:hypothetical protein
MLKNAVQCQIHYFIHCREDTVLLKITIYLSVVVKAQVPRSRLVAGVSGEMSKSKMSIGKPMVVQAFGIY